MTTDVSMDVSTDAAIRRVQDQACRHFGVARDDLVGPRRTRELVYARHVAIYVARHLTRASLPEIGRAFGGRDHTTVLYAVRRIDLAARQSPEIVVDVRAIEAACDREVWGATP